MDYAIGIDLGGTQIKFLVTNKFGTIIDKSTCKTNDNNPIKGFFYNNIQKKIQSIENKKGRKAKWIGIAAPGMSSYNKSKIISLPGRLEGLENLNWTKFLNRDHFIPVINDAHAALYGEIWQGAAQKYKNVILLTLGTGIGGAFSINGILQEGTLGRAGHFGHTSLNPYGELDIKNNPGSIEMYFGECTVKKRTNGLFTNTKDLVKSYLKGDKIAYKFWMKQVYYLACSLSSFINILDPEIILLGGGISKANKALLDPLNHFMNKVEWRPHKDKKVKIQIASLGNTAGALGAIRYAILHSKKYSKSHNHEYTK